MAELTVDIRILPSETPEDAEAHLRAAIGDELIASVDMEPIFPNPDSTPSRPARPQPTRRCGRR